jgi:hypothetical protein
MTNIIIPSSEEDRKRIKAAMEEISNSYTRVEAERDFVKEAINSLSEDVDVPKTYYAKWLRFIISKTWLMSFQKWKTLRL